MDLKLFRLAFICICWSVLYHGLNGQCPAGRAGQNCVEYDYAFNKSAEQKNSYLTETQQLAIDGIPSTCSNTTAMVDPWWTVNIGYEVNVEGLTLYIGAETRSILKVFTIEVHTASTGRWGMCYDHNSDTANLVNPVEIACKQVVRGNSVRITVHNQAANLVLCTVGVYGSCVNGTYGSYCTESCGGCHLNNTVCDKVTGRCPIGCDEGWRGDQCKQPCANGTFGDKCTGRCGLCLDGKDCSRYNGWCPDNLCHLGYMPPFCNEECPDGTYGVGCALKCGACNTAACNKTNGHCMGCLPGYQPVLNNAMCTKLCYDYTWGERCGQACPKCYQAVSTDPGPCNKTDGTCALGCAAGYYNNSACLSECPDGTWGIDCKNTCGQCAIEDPPASNNWKSAVCLKKDGGCPHGCLVGYQGLRCVDKCTDGTYGRNCDKTCGKCLGICSSTTGKCPGECSNGYTGEYCTEACDKGYYGFKCLKNCPKNCATPCSIIDGSCICKSAWTGPQCATACRFNHYGPNCESPCGNCREGSTCNQTNGYCAQGCKTDWTGLKCDSKVIRETYEEDYGPVIGGAIGGTIAGGLIIAFIVWIVYRYKKDKSIHIKALASSLKRMSIRRSKQLRRSFQRLSFRNRRPQDQKNLRDDAEHPAQASHHHKGRAYHGRMYDCVHLQSNMIHYDDFTRLHLQLQETSDGGRTLLYKAFESFLSQRSRDPSTDGNAHHDGKSYYNTAAEDVHVEFPGATKKPEFLPLGSNLSGFLLVNAPADDDVLWNHLQQRQIETLISIGHEASFTWRPGERLNIGMDVVECVDMQLYGAHKEYKLTVQKRGVQGRRVVRHLECPFMHRDDPYPLIPTLLLFIERFQQLHASQRERSILINYVNLHDHAILFTLVASLLEILRESKRIDILRTVAIGGNATTTSIRDFEGFKYLHDVVFHYIASTESKSTSI